MFTTVCFLILFRTGTMPLQRFSIASLAAFDVYHVDGEEFFFVPIERFWRRRDVVSRRLPWYLFVMTGRGC
jgi:hypothetical protein